MSLGRGRRVLVAAAACLLTAAALPADFAEGIAAFDRGDFQAAHRLLLPLAEQGDARAAIVVAGDFYVGWGVAASDALAEEWRVRAKAIASAADFSFVVDRWRNMAGAGAAPAQAVLGAAYYAGFGVPMDPVEAVKWIRAAADQGNPRGQYALGELYLEGDGVPQDVAEASRWLSLAAAQGDLSAERRLAMLAEKGLVPGRDGRSPQARDSRTLEGYRIAAAGGNPLAQMRLGEAYLRGDLVTQDVAEAYQWLMLALARQARLAAGEQRDVLALLGWAEAMLSDAQERAALQALAEKCRAGSGVPQDDALARRFTEMTVQGKTVDAAQAEAALPPGEDCLSVSVRPSLRQAVRTAVEENQPPPVIRFEGDPGAELCGLNVELTFSVSVDQSRQAKNWRDTEGADTEAIVIGSILPWPCPTTHSLVAVVRSRSGERLDSFESSVLEKRTGTMLTCTSTAGPSDAIAVRLVGEVFRKMKESTKLPVSVSGAQ